MRRCKIDLTFEALHPIWFMRGDSVEAQTVAGGMHTEQIGKVNGTIEFDKVYPFNDGYCIRDHSRGPRDPKDFYRYCWMSGHFPASGRGFYVYLMESRGTEGHGMANAMISDGQQLHEAKVTQSGYLSCVEDGKTLPSVTIESALGTMQIRATRFTGRVVNSFWRPFDNSIGFNRDFSSAYVYADGLVLECDGETGTGWCERGFAPEPL